MAPEKLHEVTGSYTMSRKARAGENKGYLKCLVGWDSGMSTESKMVSRREEPSFPSFLQAPDHPGKNPGHRRQHKEASLFHDSDLARSNISTPRHPPPAHPVCLKKKKIHGSFSHLSSASPPSFKSAVGSKREKSSFLTSPQVTATSTDLS